MEVHGSDNSYITLRGSGIKRKNGSQEDERLNKKPRHRIPERLGGSGLLMTSGDSEIYLSTSHSDIYSIEYNNSTSLSTYTSRDLSVESAGDNLTQYSQLDGNCDKASFLVDFSDDELLPDLPMFDEIDDDDREDMNRSPSFSDRSLSSLSNYSVIEEIDEPIEEERIADADVQQPSYWVTSDQYINIMSEYHKQCTENKIPYVSAAVPLDLSDESDSESDLYSESDSDEEIIELSDSDSNDEDTIGLLDSDNDTASNNHEIIDLTTDSDSETSSVDDTPKPRSSGLFYSPISKVGRQILKGEMTHIPKGKQINPFAYIEYLNGTSSNQQWVINDEGDLIDIKARTPRCAAPFYRKVEKGSSARRCLQYL